MVPRATVDAVDHTPISAELLRPKLLTDTVLTANTSDVGSVLSAAVQLRLWLQRAASSPLLGQSRF